MDLRILRYESLPSTNSEALAQARKGAPEGLCVVADEQTEGRGRLGRKWVSSPGGGLYFSAVLRPKADPGSFPLLTLAAAVAVHDALEQLYGIDCDIKWPNDLLAGDRKIAGILAETADTDEGPAVVIGIGINLRSSYLPTDLESSSASVESETGSPGQAEELLETLVRHLFFQTENTGTDEGREAVLAEWVRHSSYARGKSVRAELGGESVEGVTEGIDETGALKVRTEGGIRVIQAGDVTSLR